MLPDGSDGSLSCESTLIINQPSAARRATAGAFNAYTRVLQLDERWELAGLRRFRHVAVYLGAERIEFEHVHLNARNVSRHRCKERVQWNLGLRREFRIPERIEVRWTRRRQTDLRWSHRRTHCVEPGIASRVAADR